VPWNATKALCGVTLQVVKDVVSNNLWNRLTAHREAQLEVRCGFNAIALSADSLIVAKTGKEKVVVGICPTIREHMSSNFCSNNRVSVLFAAISLCDRRVETLAKSEGRKGKR